MGKWPDDIYGFWVFWGSLGENMKGGGGPGQNRPFIYEIFTPEFTAAGLGFSFVFFYT